MSEQPAVKLGDLEDAMMFVSSGGTLASSAWLRRDTGEVICHNTEIEDVAPLPADIDDQDRYLEIPDKREFGLGKPLALDFARTKLPECFEQVRDIFSRRGAYGRFKDLLDRHDSLDAWYEWEREQTQQALREWCAENGVKLAD